MARSPQRVSGSHSKARARAAFKAHVSSGKVAFFDTAGIDFVLGRREGVHVWDLSGEKQLIDCHCNGGVYNLGHRHPAVIEALTAATQSYDIGNHHLISEPRARLAERLTDLTPGQLAYTVFGVAGGEAIDLAIKVARGFTGRTTILSAKGGYHGHTGLSLAAGDPKWYERFGPPAPGFEQVPFNDVAALEAAITADTAAILLETVPATSGIVVPEDGYLTAVRALCDAHDVLLIIDEVQAGLGRTGKLWAVDHFGVVPDILVLGKGLSGGLYPMSATCFRAELEQVFHPDPFVHVSTFGGAEVGCAVAHTVFDLTTDAAFLENVGEVAAVFRTGFEQLQTRHPQLLVRLRQLGLMMGVEMAHPACGPLFSRAAYDHGILSVYAGNDSRVAQLLPPLIIDKPTADEVIERVDGALGQVAVMMEAFGVRP